MSKENEKITKKENFHLAVLGELKKTTNLKKIQKNLGLYKEKLNYYLRQLKKKGFVRHKGYGWWEPTKESENLTEYGSFLKKDSIRGHGYIWNIKLPKKIKGWEKRLQIIEKKGIPFELVVSGKIPRIKVLGRKVWLCKNHIRIFDKKKQSYYGETAKESKQKGIQQLFEILRVLENKLGFYFKPLEFDFQKEHYALIKNDLAIEHNRKGIIMKISDKKGQWLLIDDSLGGGGELENIGKKAYPTNIQMQKWWNDKKEHNFKITDTLLLNSIYQVTNNQKYFAEQMVFLKENLKTHFKVLGGMEKGVEKQNKIQEGTQELLKEIRNFFKNFTKRK